MITENILRVKVETTGDGQLKASLGDAAQSVSQLDEAQQGAATSAAATAEATKDATAATTALGESAAETDARIKAMVRSSLERQQAELSAANATTRATQTNASATVGYQRLVDAQNNAMRGATDMVRAEEKASAAAANTAGLEKQRGELGKLIGQIDPTVAALEKLDAQQAKLNAFRAKGVLGTDDYKQFSAVIDQSRDRIAAAGNAMHSFSLNNAMARRELGYLAKDLATGQYGRLSQSALTLASNTGIMGLAFSGAGLAIAGVTGAIATLVFAYEKGRGEEEAYNKSLILTGNYAQTTSTHLADLAGQLDNVAGVTQHSAAAALAAVAGTGKFTGDAVEQVAKAALQMQQATGQSIDKTIEQFAALGKDPVAGILALNDAQHFLTQSQYDAIKALQDHGREQEAFALAVKVASDSVNERTRDVADNLGSLQRTLNSVSSTWSEFWDAAYDIGRKETPALKIKQLNQDIAGAMSGNGVYQGMSPEAVAAFVARTKAKITQLQASDFSNVQGGVLGDPVVDSDRIRAQDAWQRDGLKYVTDRAKLEHDITEARAAGTKAGESDVAIEQRVTQIRADYAAKAAKKGGRGTTNREPAAYSTFSSQVDALDRKTIQGDTDAMTQYQQGIAKLAADMDVYLQKGGDATKAAAEFNRGQQALQRTLDDNHKRELAGQKEYAAALDLSNAALQQSIDNQVAHIGMGDQEYQRAQQLNAAYQEQAKQLRQLALQRQAGIDGEKGGLSQSAYDADAEKLRRHTAEKVAIMNDGYRTMDEAQADWLGGASTAWKNYAVQANDRAAQAQQGITTLFSDAEDAAANWLQGGKLTFKSFEKDFENMLAHMVAKALIAQAVTGLINLVAGSYGAGSTNTFSNNGTDSMGGAINFVSQVGGRAEGGKITGPGTGTSDSVLIRASAGEYMQTADATSYYGERFMDDIRAKRLPRYAQGGMIGGGSGGGGGAGTGDMTVNIYGADNGARTEQREGSDGRKYLDIFINAAAQDVARGGRLGQAVLATTGTRRPARSYAAAEG